MHLDTATKPAVDSLSPRRRSGERVRERGFQKGATIRWNEPLSPAPIVPRRAREQQSSAMVGVSRCALRRFNSQQSLEHFSSVHTLNDMVSRRTSLSPLLASLAAATLLVWLAALVFCSADCFFGDSHCQPSHHEEQAVASHHEHDQTPDSDKHNERHDSACDSLKTLVPTAHSNVLPKPDFCFCVLGFVSPPQGLAVAQIETPISRQPPDRDWLFTPEVYLGPAFRSHAPPVLL